MHSLPFIRLSRLLLLFFGLLVAYSCKKSTPTDPNPDLVAKVAGRYTFGTIITGANSQPATVSNGTAVVLRNGTSIDTADLTLSYAIVGSSGSSSYAETKTLTLKAAGDNVDLYSGTSKVGTWMTLGLALTNYPITSSSVSLTATK